MILVGLHLGQPISKGVEIIRFLRRPGDSILPEASLVVFFCSAAEANAIDLASGPFSPRVGPRGGHLKPFASVHSQHYGDTLEHLAALYPILTGQPASEALLDLRYDPPGAIARVSDGFVRALAAIGPPQREGQDLWAIYDRIAAGWLTTIKWRKSMQLSGLSMRIFTYAYACRRGAEKGTPVWAWHGKAAPEYVIAHGVGEESYDAYRRQRRKR